MSTALYRRYRPETFAEVIGQEHVTEPLMTALQNNRVNHAYLFSGPRGCGKTTSARILARCLNCAQGPTPTPCGVCDSCVELARDGSGSLDVIEMDAASHGGVDHARDLRERATFAPVRDRYKIFIIDEAHMVTREGFNALLKIVEEPPEHIKFIFATTEPNKVLGTIRSRTHHYPFRLVPPETLHDYLAQLCDEEGVKVEDGVLQLVVRAGGGSVRDSLSTLDQLMAGSGENGITYDLAVALLGFTHAELLDEVVVAFAAGNAAEVFTSVDRVIQTGQDPRRFVEDLLERFRDLIIVQAVPESADSILHGMSTDQIARLRSQATAFGSAELSRAADVTNAGLNEMSGATSPQLHLELLCARILLPASDKTIGGVGARLDRLERRVANGDIPTPAQNLPREAELQREGAAPHTVAPQNASAPLSGQTQQSQTQQPPLQREQGTQQTSTAPLANLRNEQEQEQRQSSSVQQPNPNQGAQTNNVQASNEQAGNTQSTVLMVRNVWREIVDHVQSPLARQWLAQCEPSKFEKGALYIRAEMSTLRQVKDYIPELKTALREVVQLDCDVHGEVAKPGTGSNASTANNSTASAPQQTAVPPLRRQNSAPQNHQGENQQTQNRAPQHQSQQGNQQTARPPIADGPRGGEEAWRAHGQPLSNEPPQWSTEDWNNPVTNWEVASIPSEDSSQPNGSSAPDSSTDNAKAESAQVENSGAKNTAVDISTADKAEVENTATPREESGPQLRVIHGEANENSDRSRENHPSSGRWQRPDISAAPNLDEMSPDDIDEGMAAPVDSENSDNSGTPTDQVTAGEQTAEESAEASPLAADSEQSQAEDKARYSDQEDSRPANTGIADGTAEAAPAEDSMIPDPPQEESSPSKNQSDGDGSSPKVAEPRPSSHEVTDEYGAYEGENFDDAPAEEPEYIAGVGYISNQTSESDSAAQPTTEKVASAPQPVAPPKQGSSFRERYAAQVQAGQRASENATTPAPARGAQEPEDFSISDEDETLESSVLIGQRAVEKVLGGVVIDERLHGQ